MCRCIEPAKHFWQQYLIIPTKITAAQNEDALDYNKVRSLFFWQLFLRRP